MNPAAHGCRVAENQHAYPHERDAEADPKDGERGWAIHMI
jgi:hypothetical protein